MKKASIAILILVLILSLFFWYKRLGKKGSQVLSNNIVAGTTADFPPFSYIDKDNNIVGFDIDIAKEVARRLNKSIKFEDIPFNSLLSSVKSGDIQIIAGISATPERREVASFTKPYLTGNPLLVVTLKNNNIDNLEDLVNKEVVVNTGYIGDIYMSKMPNIILKRVTSISDAFELLKNRQADAFVGAFHSIKPLLEKNNANFNTFIITEMDENSSIAVSYLYPELFKDIEVALKNMEIDGTLQAYKQKWNII